MVYFPSEHLGKAYKFSRPFYQVDRVFPNGAEVTSLGGDKRQTIRAALDRVRHCLKELSDHLEEYLIFDGLEKLCEGGPTKDDPIASEAVCTGSQSSPPPSRNTEAEPEKEKPETRRVRRSKRIRNKRSMS